MAKPTQPDSLSPAMADKPPQPAPAAEPDWHQKALDQAWNAREMMVPACFASTVGEKNMAASGAKVYFNSFLRDAGEPTDPVERILLEQLLMAHHRVAQLHARAEGVTSPEGQKILNGATTRLLGEVRRLALAIRQYRSPISSRQFSVVHQQNVVAAGSQQVSYLDKSTAAQGAAGDNVSFSARTELGAEHDAIGLGGRLGRRLGEDPVQEPPEGRRRQEASSMVG